MTLPPRVRLQLQGRTCIWYLQDEAHPAWTPFLRSSYEPEQYSHRVVFWEAAGFSGARGILARLARPWGLTLRELHAVVADAMAECPERPQSMSFDQLLVRHCAHETPIPCAHRLAEGHAAPSPPPLKLLYGNGSTRSEALVLPAEGVVWTARYRFVPHLQTDCWLPSKELLEAPAAWTELIFARSSDRLVVWGRCRGRPRRTSLNPLHPIPPVLLTQATPALLLSSSTPVYQGPGWVEVAGYVTLNGQLRLDAIYKRSALHTEYRQVRASLSCSVVGKNHHVSKGRIHDALRRVTKAATARQGKAERISLDTTQINTVLTAFGSIRVSAP